MAADINKTLSNEASSEAEGVARVHKRKELHDHRVLSKELLFGGLCHLNRSEL